MGDPPVIRRAVAPPGAVVLSVPHAGRDYSGLDDLARVSLTTLEGLEDRHADSLIETAVERSASAIVAGRARAWIDFNRNVADLDTGMVTGSPRATLSPRAAAGLGLVPRRLAVVGELWRRPLSLPELTRRLEDHAAFHTAVGNELSDARTIFGRAVLLDIHSMPPLPAAVAADIVIGDRHGQSARPETIACAVHTLQAAGFHVTLNRPYAGGEIIARHGAPREQIEALQIEFCRSLYLERDLRTISRGVHRLNDALTSLVQALSGQFASASVRP